MASIASTERIRQVLERLPIFPLFVAYGLFIGYQYYSFMNDADSPRQQIIAQVTATQDGIAKLKVKIQEAQEATRVLLQKQVELRDLARQLSEAKATLSEQTNEAEFLRLILKEADSVGLKITGLKPTTSKDYEYYSEQTFEVTFKGYFIQLIVFLDRLSQTERIVRVDNFDMHREGSNLSPYVELGGNVQVKVYRYLGSKADELANSVTPAPAPAPVAQPPAAVLTPAASVPSTPKAPASPAAPPAKVAPAMQGAK
jgi:Tfp pilus assembly protein PilO